MLPMQSEQIDLLVPDLIKAKAAFGAIEKKSESKVSYDGKDTITKYANLEDLLKPIAEPLANNGLSIDAFDNIYEGRWVLILKILHKSGQWIQSMCPINIQPFDEDEVNSKGYKKKRPNIHQQQGIAQTYALRYLVRNLLCLAVSDENDNDGAQPDREEVPAITKQEPKSEFISDKQYWLIINKTKKMPDVLEAIFEDHNITDLKKLPWKKMQDVMALIEANEIAEKEGTR